MKIGLSSGAYGYFSLEEIVKRARCAGFDGVEACLPKDFASLIWGEEDLAVLSIHAPNIMNIRWLVLTCWIAHRNKIPIVVIHPTIRPGIVKLFSRTWGYLGVAITIENIPRIPAGDLQKVTRLGVNPSWLLPETEIIQRFAGIPFTLDVGHAVKLGQNPSQLVEQLDKNLAHVHLHDCDGVTDHLDIGAGGIDFEIFFDSLKSLNYAGAVILEVGTLELEEQTRRVREFM